MSPRLFAGLVGAVLLLVGVVAMYLPVTGEVPVRVTTMDMPCGSGWSGTPEEYSGDTERACDEAVTSRRAWAVPLMVVGGIALAGAAVVRTQPGGRAATQRV